MSASDADVQTVLDSVISAGQTSRKSVGVAEIKRLIAVQPEVNGPVTVRDLRATAKVGASSGIVVFTADYDDGNGPQSHNLVLRHAPGSEGRIFYQYDLGRQFRVQKALQGAGLPVPNPLWLDETGEHLGLPGYIMEALEGEAPNPSAFAQGPIAAAAPAERELMLDSVLRALAKIHALDFKRAGLADFAMPAEGATTMQKCINWYWQTWEWIQDRQYARLVPLRRWLLDNAPAGGDTLTHGDSTLHNYLFVGSKLTGVLDFEMSCLGRPESDIALQALGNELFAAPVDSGLSQPPSQEQWLERYARVGGVALDSLDYYRRLSAYMILVALVSLQKGMTEHIRASQRTFMERLWHVAENS